MTTNAPAQTNLDRSLALSRVGGDEELLRELALLFIEEYPRLMADLREARQKRDSWGVERAAHSLKGSVANFGAKEVVEIAASAEQCARCGDLAAIDGLLPTLETTLANLHKELTEL